MNSHSPGADSTHATSLRSHPIESYPGEAIIDMSLEEAQRVHDEYVVKAVLANDSQTFELSIKQVAIALLRIKHHELFVRP